MSEKERRTFKGRVELRKRGDNVTLTGYAAVFNSETDLGEFREVIRPGAFRKAVRSDDVRALWNHDDNIVLGRTKPGTLRLEEDDHGLRVEIDAPRSAESIVESIQRGDVDAMSFGFSVRSGGDRWSGEKGSQMRELIDLRLLDVSPVTFPAYEATTISAEARSMVQGWDSDTMRRRRELKALEAKIRAGEVRERAKRQELFNRLRARMDAIGA